MKSHKHQNLREITVPEGFCKMSRTPATSWLRNLPLSALLNNDLLKKSVKIREITYLIEKVREIKLTSLMQFEPDS